MYIIVLAGGVEKNHEPNGFVKKRLDKAITLNNCNKNSIIIILGGGTYHKPPNLDNNNFIIHESTSCANYLIKKGVDPNKIIREWSSYDTIANGYFAFINYIVPLKIKSCYIITSKFHMNRTQTIFNYFNKLITGNKVFIDYINTENILEEDILLERCKREESSEKKFKENIINKINSLHNFTMWFYTEHNAYKSIISYYNDYLINKTY
jgi:uncharacterized SAM-binding protein YcdF (DUF218 family)